MKTLALLALLVACPARDPAATGSALSLRFELPGQACVDQGFVGWGVEVTRLATGERTIAFVEPFAWATDGEPFDLDGEAYLFGDYWHGLDEPGDYHVKVYGVVDGSTLEPATFMTGDEAVVTIVGGLVTEVALVTRCASSPGGLDVIVVVDGGPALIGFDIDMKWVAVCEETTFTATFAGDGPFEVHWAIVDEDGRTILEKTDTGPVSILEAWVPTPGDYTGTVTVTDVHGSTSVFSFPWHVRDPAIALGACDDGGDPVLLLSCDPTDGIALVDDPACLADAFPSCPIAATPEPFVGPWLEVWLYRDEAWQVGARWSDAVYTETLPLEACTFDGPTTWEVDLGGGTARIAIGACDEVLEVPSGPLDTYVLKAAPGQATVGDGACPDLEIPEPPATGPPECTDLGFPHGFKIDATPEIGRYPVGGGWIEITRLYVESSRTYGLDWIASRPIGAAVLKAQDRATYLYDPPVTAGLQLETPQRKDISNVVFCWGAGALGSVGWAGGPMTGTLSPGTEDVRLLLGNTAVPQSPGLPMCDALITAWCDPP